jgi:hypothetical protein
MTKWRTITDSKNSHLTYLNKTAKPTYRRFFLDLTNFLLRLRAFFTVIEKKKVKNIENLNCKKKRKMC